MKGRNGKIRWIGSAEKDMATAGDLFGEKAASEGTATRGAAMATFLRSAIGRASERLVATAASAKLSVVAEQPEEDNQSHDKPADGDSALDERHIKEEAAVACCETASSSDMEVEEEEEEHDAPQFEVQIHETPKQSKSAPSIDDDTLSKAEQWAYCDVLLRPDEWGFGFNLTVKPTPDGYRYSTATSIILVASFRRLHGEDVGPAEACGKIRVGDILYSIDGERVSTLEAVAASLGTVAELDSTGKPSVLLRFLRPIGAVCEAPTAVHSLPVTKESLTSLLESRPDIAMLIRELVLKNQSLEEQLLASRHKQEEQRIQLDQLHTLYAKTQLENWTATKPFARRSAVDSSSFAKPRAALSSAAARLMGTNPMQYDVEFAIRAECERLTRKFEQQLSAERNALQTKFDARLEAICSAADKKIAMLEFGVKQLLSRPATVADGDDSGESSACPAEVSPHVVALRHQLVHRTTRSRSCVLCLLSGEFEAMDFECTTRQDACRDEIVKILKENAVLISQKDDTGIRDLQNSKIVGDSPVELAIPEIVERCNSDAEP